MIRTVKSGKVVEKSQFFVGERKPRAPKRKGSSSLAKKDSNMNQAVRRLARILNCNFHKGDLFVTLTYDEEHFEKLGGLPENADKACQLFWRRLSRTLSDIGIKIRGVWITADKDEATGAPVRLHHHMVIGAEGFDITWKDRKLESCKVNGRDLASIWGNGSVHVEYLKSQDDYTAVANYMARQAVGGANAKKWHTSRGLDKPVVLSEKVSASPHELRAPGGADVKEIGHYDEQTGSHYIRYIRRPEITPLMQVEDFNSMFESGGLV